MKPENESRQFSKIMLTKSYHVSDAIGLLSSAWDVVCDHMIPREPREMETGGEKNKKKKAQICLKLKVMTIYKQKMSLRMAHHSWFPAVSISFKVSLSKMQVRYICFFIYIYIKAFKSNVPSVMFYIGILIIDSAVF